MREKGNGPIGQSPPVMNSPLHSKTLAIPQCLEWALSLLSFFIDGLKHMEGALQA